MRMLIALLVVLFASPLALAQGVGEGDSNRVANCLVEIGGEVQYDWFCMITDHADPLTGEPWGFTLNGVPGLSHVNVRFPRHGEPLTSDWSGDPPDPYVPENLGVLTPDGTCWLGEAVRICVSDPLPRYPDGKPSRLADCLIQVDGVVYADGACLIDDIELPPSGEISGFVATQVMGHTFAYVDFPIDGEPQMGTWNGDPPESHAHDELGVLHPEGPCWVGDRARVCVYE